MLVNCSGKKHLLVPGLQSSWKVDTPIFGAVSPNESFSNEPLCRRLASSEISTDNGLTWKGLKRTWAVLTALLWLPAWAIWSRRDEVWFKNRQELPSRLFAPLNDLWGEYKSHFPSPSRIFLPTNYRRTKLDLRTTRSTFCSRGNSTQSLKGWRNMPGATLGSITAFILSCCHQKNLIWYYRTATLVIVLVLNLSFCYRDAQDESLNGCALRQAAPRITLSKLTAIQTVLKKQRNYCANLWSCQGNISPSKSAKLRPTMAIYNLVLQEEPNLWWDAQRQFEYFLVGICCALFCHQ